MKNTKRKTKEERTSETILQEQKQDNILFSCQVKKDEFKKLIKKQVAYIPRSRRNNIFSAIHFELENNILTMVSTDATKMLCSRLVVDNPYKSGQGNYNGIYLGKISFIKNILYDKSYTDVMDLIFKRDGLTIIDYFNQITYNVPVVCGEYPNYKKLFPDDVEDKKKYTTVAVNISYLEQLKNLSPNPKNNILKLHFDKKNVCAPILAECDNEGLDSKCLIMPIDISRT